MCGAAWFGVTRYWATPLTPAEMVQRLPTQDALVAAIDFDALRKLGVMQMLDGSKMEQEADYAQFVQQTHFNYTQDLDYVAAAFSPRGKFILARGRFDWKALREYAAKQGGQCYDSLCRMTGSTPDRHISFLPVKSNLMALAVSKDDDAALTMQAADHAPSDVPTPNASLWLYLPPAILKSPDLPEGTVLFARSMNDAKSVTIGFAPEGDHIAAKLDALCKSDQEALVTTAELAKLTEVLRSVIAHQGQHPNPGDWSGVLTSGKFENKGPRVSGYWPIDRAFVRNMLGGQ